MWTHRHRFALKDLVRLSAFAIGLPESTVGQEVEQLKSIDSVAQRHA
jgi:hypothetical protein